MKRPQMTDIETHSGLYFSLARPHVDDVLLDDIAWGLAHTARFGGHTSTFYSVAEHAVLVSKVMETWPAVDPALDALVGLHHDDAEAYIGDVVRPMKELLGWQLRQIEEEVATVIYQALDLPASARERLTDKPTYPLLACSDNWALAVEAACFLPSQGEGWNLIDPYAKGPSFIPQGWDPTVAYDAYLARHDLLVNRLKEGDRI